MATTVSHNINTISSGTSTSVTYSVSANTCAVAIVEARENNATGSLLSCTLSGVTGWTLLGELSVSSTESSYTDYVYHAIWYKWYGSANPSQTLTATINKSIDRLVVQVVEVTFDSAPSSTTASLASGIGDGTLGTTVTYGAGSNGSQVKILSAVCVDPYTATESFTFPTFTGYTQLWTANYNQTVSIAEALWTGYAINTSAITGGSPAFSSGGVQFMDSTYVVDVAFGGAILTGMNQFNF